MVIRVSEVPERASERDDPAPRDFVHIRRVIRGIVAERFGTPKSCVRPSCSSAAMDATNLSRRVASDSGICGDGATETQHTTPS